MESKRSWFLKSGNKTRGNKNREGESESSIRLASS